MRARVAQALIGLAWFSIAYVVLATYLTLFRHSGTSWVPWLAVVLALFAILGGAVGAVLAPPRLSPKGAWASAAASALFVLPALLLGFALLLTVGATR